jgi:cell division inhibitor SulA
MRLFRSTSLPLLVLSIVVPPASAQTQNNQTTLEQGSAIERAIGPTESHAYTITLGDGQYLQFVVNQHGIDLIVRVFSPTGKSLGEFDSPNGPEGPENVSIVAMTSGNYRIVVAPLEPKSITKAGRYELRILELREATDQELKVGKSEEARKAKGLALLNEIVDSIPEIRQPQTRIRVKLQCGNLLWSVDEKKAAKLLTEAVTDSRDYVLTLKPDEETYDEAHQWAMQIRFEAVQTLASHDPEAALSLLRSTRTAANPESDRREQEPERQLELSLASQISAKNPQRAFELAEESLKDGLSGTLIQTLNSLSRANQELAGTLAKDITAKLVNQNLLKNPEAIDVLLSLLQSQGTKNSNGPLLSEQDYRALVQKALSAALSAPAAERGYRDDNVAGGFVIVEDGNFRFGGPQSFIGSQTFVMKGNMVEMLLMNLKEFVGSQLDNIVPGSTAAIDKKLKEFRGANERQSFAEYENTISNSSTDVARDAITQAPPEMKEQLLQRLAEQTIKAGNYAQAKQLITETIGDPRARRQALNNLERQAAYADFNQGRTEEALKHIAKLSTTEERATILSEMASRIGPGQKRAAALALLETARSLLGTSIQAEGQQQMHALLQLAGAFSRYDSKRAFEILEPLVDQFNDLSEAARTLNGFGPQFFVGGELSMQNGNSLGSIANPLANTLGILSLTDFDRAKSTSDRLQLPEVRLTAHLGIAQQAIMPNGIYSPSAVYMNSLNR